MGKEFQQQSVKLETCLNLGNSKAFLSLWSNVVEDSVLNAGNITEPKERKQIKGHGEVVLQKKKNPISGTSNKHNGTRNQNSEP